MVAVSNILLMPCSRTSPSHDLEVLAMHPRRTFLLVLVCLSSSACGSTGFEPDSLPDLGEPVRQVPEVSPALVTDITSSGAVVNMGVYNPYIAMGVVWDTLPNPTIALDTKITVRLFVIASMDDRDGNFDVPLSGLAAGTTYYVRGWATSEAGTGYGFERSFTTLQMVPPPSG